MKILWRDLETYNDRDLSVGTYRYAETAEIIVDAYAIDDGPVYVWDRANCELFRLDGGALVCVDPLADDVPADLHAAETDPAVLVTAHNAQFDRVILEAQRRRPPGRRQASYLRAPRIALERWRCTMVQAYSHAYPGGLDQLCRLLGVPADTAKLADGKKLIQRFCKPAPANHKAARYDRNSHPAEWARFLLYAGLDVAAMREVAKRLPVWNWRPADVALWHLDQRINDRGMAIDRALVEAGAAAATTEKAALAREFVELTGGAVTSPTQREAFRLHLNAAFGLTLDNTRKDTLQPLVDSGTLDPTCRRLMEIALLANKTSTAKYAALLPALQDDDRFRGGLQFRGAARTRRYAGRVFQPQNLPSRGLPKQSAIDLYIDALKAELHTELFDDLMTYGAAALRGVVVADVADPSARLAVADLSNIEGRLGAWFADETWKLQAFRDYDAGRGDDLYNITAASILGGAPSDVSKFDRNVFGKVPDLACLYAGGFGAFQTFAQAYGLKTLDGRSMSNHAETIYRNVDPKLVSAAKANWTAWGQERTPDADPEEWLACEAVKLAWRARHPATVRLWQTIKDSVVAAIERPGVAYKAGRWLTYQMQEHAGVPYLLCRLPAGSFICYAEPRVHDDGAITYMGIDATATGGQFGKWQRLFTHPGKFLEQACQSTALDVLMHAFPAIEAAGLQIVLSVHDEVICERTGDAGAPELARLMSVVPAWAPGLPLAAAGFETYRYRKD